MRVTEFMGTFWLVLGGCGSGCLRLPFRMLASARRVGYVLKAGATYHSTTIFRFSAN